MTDFRYTPRTVGMIKLHARTMSPATIAMIMRCSIGTVELICRKHGIETRESDKIEPLPVTCADRSLKRQVDIDLDGVSLHIVANEARRRGVPTRDLIAQLVEAIAEECIFSAVLDR
jgi:hypothetical protein